MQAEAQGMREVASDLRRAAREARLTKRAQAQSDRPTGKRA